MLILKLNAYCKLKQFYSDQNTRGLPKNAVSSVFLHNWLVKAGSVKKSRTNSPTPSQQLQAAQPPIASKFDSWVLLVEYQCERTSSCFLTFVKQQRSLNNYTPTTLS